MHPLRQHKSTAWRATAILLLMAGASVEVLARVGGGQSYGGGGSHGGGGGGGALIWLVFQLVRLLIYLTIEYPVVGIPLDLIVISLVVLYVVRRNRGRPTSFVATTRVVPNQVQPAAEQATGRSVERQFDQLRRFDPNFSEIIFTDFCYALYGKAQDARGHGKESLALFSPYLSETARGSLLQRNPADLREVKGVIVGAMPIIDVDGLETPLVHVAMMFEANYTEVTGAAGQTGGEMTYYVRERWDLERKRDVLSPPPGQATALHCPRCGAPLQRDSVGACAFCRTKIDSGEFQWFVREITLVGREARGPLLTQDVPEVGTDYRSVVQPGFA